METENEIEFWAEESWGVVHVPEHELRWREQTAILDVETDVVCGVPGKLEGAPNYLAITTSEVE